MSVSAERISTSQWRERLAALATLADEHTPDDLGPVEHLIDRLESQFGLSTTPPSIESTAGERFSALAETAPVAIVQVVGNRIRYANAAAERILGYTDSELLVLGLNDLAHPEDTVDLGRLLLCAERGSGSSRREIRFLAKNGQTRWVDVSAALVQMGDEPSLLITGLDVTRAKRTQAALVESEARWKSLATNAPDLILTTDLDGMIQFINRGVGHERREIVGESLYDYIHPNHHAEVRTRIREVIETGEARDYKVAGYSPAGEPVWYESRVGPVKRGAGVAALLIIARDITERRAVEEEIRRKEAELAHILRMNTVGEIGSGLAHELNQPLTAIGNYAYVLHGELERDGHVPRSTLERLEVIREQCLRAGAIIKQLREFLRKHQPERVSTNVNDVVREALEFIQQELTNGHVQIELELSDLPMVSIDRVQLQQVLINLVLNGIEAMESLPMEQRRMCLQTEGDECGVHVRVHDDGAGLPEQHRHRVFDQFFTTKANGLGMGLPICRTIIEMYEGHLWAEPRVPQGTTFTFFLPIAQGEND